VEKKNDGPKLRCKKIFEIQQFKNMDEMLDTSKEAPSSDSYYDSVPAGISYP
jgi:hypothetical protein